MACEVRRHGVTVFSAHPGPPRQAVDLLLRVATGDADRLSGSHLSVHDDLDALLAQAPEIEPAQCFVDNVRAPERLLGDALSDPAAGGAAATGRPNRAPAYYLGRPAGLWQRIMGRPAIPRRTSAEGALDRAA